jgi:hypothetical protein
MSAIASRIKGRDTLELQKREEEGHDLAAILLERRRRRAINEGREPEPDPPKGPLADFLKSRAVLVERVQWKQRLEGVEEKLASAGDTSKSTSPLGRHPPTGQSGLRLVGENK